MKKQGDIFGEILLAGTQAVGYIIVVCTFPLWILPFLYNRWRNKP